MVGWGRMDEVTTKVITLPCSDPASKGYAVVSGPGAQFEFHTHKEGWVVG